MERMSALHNFKALRLLRQAAREYNNADFKFYSCGFVKFVRENEHTVLIDDIYIEPEFRSTELASIMLGNFENYLKKENILTYYGRVFKSGKDYQKRINTFEKWGMKVIGEINDLYTIVQGNVR
jgi:ribosomal protein S18 acetylase RimI-like enzyme